jgi:hypothetical protein
MQLLSQAPFFSREDSQRDSSPRGWGPRRGTSAAARGILATSVPLPLVSAKLVATVILYILCLGQINISEIYTFPFG